MIAFSNSITQSVSTNGSNFVREMPAVLNTTHVGYNPNDPASPAAGTQGYFTSTGQGMWFKVLGGSKGVIIDSIDTPKACGLRAVVSQRQARFLSCGEVLATPTTHPR